MLKMIKFINIIIKNTINKAEQKKTKRKRKIKNKKIQELESSGFSSMIKDLFNDKINKKILKLKDLEINERLLKAITSPNVLGGPPRLALPPPPPRLALPPPPPSPNILGGLNILAMPSSQILLAAQNHLRPVSKKSIFDLVFEEKIFHNDKEYIIPKKLIEAYNEQIKIEKKLKEEKQKKYEDLLDSKKKFQKSEKQKQKLRFNENATKFSSSQNLTRKAKRKIFEAFGVDPQRSDDRRQAKSKIELMD